MKEFQGTIVDVRTVEEFSGGHVVDSVNIPLQEIMKRIDEVKALKEEYEKQLKNIVAKLNDVFLIKKYGCYLRQV